MYSRKEFKVTKKDIRTLFLIVLLPLIAAFVFEHFGNFNYKEYSEVTKMEGEVSNVEFKTFFGDVIEVHMEGEDVVSHQKLDGNFKIGSYWDEVPYMIQAVFTVDFLYPFTAIFFCSGIFLFKDS